MSAAFRKVGVVAKVESPEAVDTAHELTDWLRRRELRVALQPDVARGHPAGGECGVFDVSETYDLVVVLGGDGTLLSVARTVVSGVPILGVNLGTLGFLTEVGRSELYPSLVEILAGRFTTEERALLDVELERTAGETRSYRILNDAVIAKSALSRIIQLTVRVDGRRVTSNRSDGLIVSTPTGSTAYNLSAGGPIVNPLLPVVVLTPICPHTFSLRPIVVPDASTVEVILESGTEEVYLTLDGQEGSRIEAGDRVRVTRSEAKAHLVKVSGRTFYHSLRGKLHWG